MQCKDALKIEDQMWMLARLQREQSAAMQRSAAQRKAVQ